MFTGIVLTTARLAALERRRDPLLVVEPLRALAVAAGDSVAVNGVCLTALESATSPLRFNLAAATLARSNLGDLPPGALLNLELALRADGLLGGHLVSGHVDGTARLKALSRASGRTSLVFTFQEPEWRNFLIHQGSVAINGVSLTLTEVQPSWFAVEVVPHTWEETNLRLLRIGERANIELDLIGKYLYNFSRNRQGPS